MFAKRGGEAGGNPGGLRAFIQRGLVAFFRRETLLKAVYLSGELLLGHIGCGQGLIVVCAGLIRLIGGLFTLRRLAWRCIHGTGTRSLLNA